jgi:hypothetical protein
MLVGFVLHVRGALVVDIVETSPTCHHPRMRRRQSLNATYLLYRDRHFIYPKICKEPQRGSVGEAYSNATASQYVNSLSIDKQNPWCIPPARPIANKERCYRL